MWDDWRELEAAQARVDAEDRERWAEPNIIRFPDRPQRPETAPEPGDAPSDPAVPSWAEYAPKTWAPKPPDMTPERRLSGLRAWRKMILAKLGEEPDDD
jgi:hypothetical protein